MFQKKCATCKAEMIGDLHAECESCRSKSATPAAAEKKSDTKATYQQISDMCEKASDQAACKGDRRYKEFLAKAVASFPMYLTDNMGTGVKTEQWDLVVEGKDCTICHRPATSTVYHSAHGKEFWYIFRKPIKA